MLLISIAAVTPCPSAAAGAVAGPAAVRFLDDGNGAIVVPVWIGGEGPFRFLLDTGSNLSALSERLADRLALAPVARTALATVGGVAMRPVVQLETVSVGGVRRSGLLASLATDAELAIVAPELDGMLGQDFLAAYNFTVDYRRRLIVWDDLTNTPRPVDAPGTLRLPLVPQDGRFVIQLPQLGGGEPLEMVPDTGASTFVLFARNGVTPVPGEWSDATVTISGLTGAKPARMTRLRELRIGSLTLRNLPVVVVDRAVGEGGKADGLLPLHQFRRVSFRVSEGYLALER